MSKWRHPYVIRITDTGFDLLCLVYFSSYHAYQYRFVDHFSSLEKALKRKSEIINRTYARQ